MRLTLVVVLLLLSTRLVTAEQPESVLVKGGQSEYVIALQHLATPPERHAARELQRFVREVTGATLPIVICSDVEGPETLLPHEIMVGWSGYNPAQIGYCPRLTSAMQKYGVRVDLNALGEDGFFIATAGPHLLIAGGRPRGTLYGVYTFLEKYLGCRWYDSLVSAIPRRRDVTLPPILDVQIPVFRQRYISWGDFRYDADLAARNKVNQGAGLSDIHGGEFPMASRGGHTFNYLLDPNKYFKDHPEYYALVDGKRQATQPCLTNPEAQAIMIENLKKWMREEPNARYFHVSQNDNDGYCRCPNCQALDDQQESQQGSLLTFINRAADEIKDEFPGRFLITFAYAYSEKAPKDLQPRPNVIIQLCTFACCSIYEYETDGMMYNDYVAWIRGGPHPGPTFGANMKRWAALTHNLFVWDYAGSLSHHLMPTPNLTRLGPNLRFLAANGAIGYYAQPPDACYGTMGGFNSLRAWLLAKLAWDPSFDVEKGIDQYLADYYGPAATPLREYLNLMHANAPPHDTRRDYNQRLAAWFHTPSDEYWLTPPLLRRYDQLFDRAEQLVADDPDLLRRVRIARLEVQYAEIRVLPPGDPRRAEIIRRFFPAVKQAGVKTIGGFILPGQWMTRVEDFRKFLEEGGH